MNIGTIVVDLANSRLQLYALKTDPAIAPTKLDYCTSIMDKLQNTIGELLTLPWIPRTVLGLNGSIAAVLANIRKTESAIDDRIEAIWETQAPDEMLRADLALIALDTLRFQLDELIEARMKMLRSTLKDIEVEFVN
jgi:hypothetical protein